MRAFILIGIGFLLLAGSVELGVYLGDVGLFFMVFALILAFIILGKGTTKLFEFRRKGWNQILIAGFAIFVLWILILNILFFQLIYYYPFSFLKTSPKGPLYISYILLFGIIFGINIILKYARIHFHSEKKLAEEFEFNEVKSLVRDAEEALENAFSLGINVPQNDKQNMQYLLNQAQKFLEVGDISSAKKYAFKCHIIIESVMKEFDPQKTEQELKKREQKEEEDKAARINEIKSDIRNAEVSLQSVMQRNVTISENIHQMLRDAKRAYAAEDFSKAKDFADKCMENLNSELEEHKRRNEEQKELERMRKEAGDKIRRAEVSLDIAKKLGIISLQNEENYWMLLLTFLMEITLLIQ